VSAAAQTVSAGGLLVQLVVGLGVILGIIALASRILRGKAASSRFLTRQNAPLMVMGRQTLGKGVSVAVVRVGSRAFVLGVTQNGVRRIAEVEPDEIGTSETDKESGRELRLLPRKEMVTGQKKEMVTGQKREPITGGNTDMVPATANRGQRPVPTWTSAIEHLREMTVRRA